MASSSGIDGMTVASSTAMGQCSRGNRWIESCSCLFGVAESRFPVAGCQPRATAWQGLLSCPSSADQTAFSTPSAASSPSQETRQPLSRPDPEPSFPATF